MNTSPERRSNHRRDDRGAVMVVCVFMAAFLVGALWYLIGIGDTIIYRQRMQDGADAVAYAGAVYHARGMNLIAMINVIMAGILAILVALKMLQLINYLALAISTVACFFGVGCPAAAFFGNMVNPIQKAVDIAQKVVDTTLPALSKAQVGIAVAMPWIAQAKSLYVGTQHYNKPVTFGAIVSTSLVPGSLDGSQMKGKSGFSDGSVRIALPVAEDKYSVLCGKAGEYVAEVVFMPFGPFKDWAKKAAGGLTKTFPGYFCGNGGISVDGSDFDIGEGIVGEACKDQKGKAKKKCEERVRKETKEKRNESLKNTASGGSAKNMTPKKVFDYASNGNVYFQVWSFAVGDNAAPKNKEAGVRIAAWGRSGPGGGIVAGIADELSKVQVAQAEFYCDRSGGWSKMKLDCMYNMWWRARLRRVRPPTDDIATMVTGILGTRVLEKVQDTIKKTLGKAGIVGSVLGSGGGDWIKRKLRDVLVSGSGKVDNMISNSMLSTAADVEMIH